MNYNLLEEKWIPVLYRNGKWDRIGIRKAFEDAGRIRQIAASNPMDRLAILRFLLALLYWCKGNPSDKANAVPGDSFPADWFSKLDANKDCFNLLGEGKRFYQDRGARRNRAATDLLQEIPTGNNFWHFRHSTDKEDGLCPACCAMGLLRLPLFSVSGLPDLKAGINGKPPVYVVPWGMSLLDTLCANWVTRVQLGDPAWVQPTMRPTPDEVVPLLTGLTLLSRRVWLHEPSAPPGMCNGCGAKEQALIRTCEFQTAGKQENDLWDDPQVVYLDKTPRKAAKALDLTAAGKFRMDRPWPDLLARVIETGKFGAGDKPISLLVVGFATDQAKNIDVWERTIAVPPEASIHNMSASLIQQWRKEGWRLEKRIERIVRSKVEGAAAIAAIRPHVEGRVSAKAGDLLARDDDAWEEAACEYRPMMEMIAKSLSPGFTTATVQRRQQIARITPDMRPRTEVDKKPGRKKGGDR
jgi:CRISPR type I-E-associated protein CasA/Cse1